MTKEYLKMADEVSLSVKEDTLEVYCRQHIGDSFGSCEVYAAHAINSHDELVAEVERLRQALIDAATSLETIHVRSYGEDSFLDSKQEMRSYAGSRAKIARAALSEQ